MSEGNLISWASAQPIWIQVFIGLALFFIGLPLALVLISELFETIGEIFSPMTKSFWKEKSSRPPLQAAQSAGKSLGRLVGRMLK